MSADTRFYGKRLFNFMRKWRLHASVLLERNERGFCLPVCYILFT